MKISVALKSLIPWVGGLLALVGVGFVAERLWSYTEQIDMAALRTEAWAALVLLCLIYGSANILLAFSWRELLRHFGVLAPRTWSIWAYGVSQIAKYVPGNIFHLAGRQAMGVSAGYSHRVMALSAFWELGLIAATATMFSVLLLPLFDGEVAPWSALVIFAVIVMGVLAIVKRRAGVFLSRAMFFHVCFLSIAAVVFVFVMAVITPAQPLTFHDGILLSGAFVMAWLAGLVTPGAPAGIGIRELVLLLLLKGKFPEADLVMGVALSRFVTASGDALFFIATSTYGRKFLYRARVE
jgi:glycosyltransferase 2 family protein